MFIDEVFAQRFVERFAAEDPDPRYKQVRPISRRELVARSYGKLVAKRRAGYSYEGIAAQFTTLGVPIRVSTLKNYLQLHAAKLRREAVGESSAAGARTAPRRRNRGDVRAPSDGSPARSSTRNVQSNNGLTSPLGGSREKRVAVVRAEPSTTSAEGAPPADANGARDCEALSTEAPRQSAEAPAVRMVGEAGSGTPATADDVSVAPNDVESKLSVELVIAANSESDSVHARPTPASSAAPAVTDPGERTYALPAAFVERGAIHTSSAGAGDAPQGRAGLGGGTRLPAQGTRFGNIGFVPRR